MKTVFIWTLLIFSSSALGESISLQEATESLKKGDIDKIQYYLKSEEESKNTACLEGVLEQIKKRPMGV